jgi:phiKZ-like phage internal head proteins
MPGCNRRDPVFYQQVRKMRKFIVALESYQAPDLAISLEEEVLLIDENAREEAQIQTDLGEVNRGLDTADALEDLAVVAGNIEDASEQETQLIDTCAQMATTGTDVQPEEFMPPAERAEDGTVATEGFRETARSIIDTILKYVAKIWDAFTGWLKRTFTLIGRTRARLDSLRKYLASVQKEKSPLKEGATVAVFDESGYQPVKDGRAYVELNRDWSKMTEWVFGEYGRYVLAMGGKAVKGIEAFDAQHAEESATKLRSDLTSVKLARMPGARRAKRVGNLDVEISDDLPHNKVLMVSDLQHGGEASTLSVLEKLRTHQVQLVDARAGEVSRRTEHAAQCKPLAFDEMMSLADEFETQLRAVEKFTSSNREGELQRTRKALAAASKKAEASLGKLDTAENPAHGKVVETYYRATLAFNAAFVNWINQPLLTVSSLALTNVRSGLVRIQESLKCYELKSGFTVPVSPHAALPA